MKKTILSLLLLLVPVTAYGQIVINPVGGGSGGSSTTIINNITNVTSNPGSFVTDGGQVVWLTGYQFGVSASTYYIDNSQYSSPETTVTLDAAHATLDRIDVIALDNTNAVVVVKGTESATPSEPTIDPGTQLKLAIVLVTHATSEPAGIVTQQLYLNNAGSPTEWNWTTSGSGFNVNSTNNPRSPATHSIEGTTVTAGSYAQGQIGTGSFDVGTANILTLYIRSKATWQNKRGLQVGLYSSGVLKGNLVAINTSGTWGYDSSVTSAYQQVAIPVSVFAVPSGQTINQIRIIDFGGSIGFYLGNIFFQGGAVVPAPTVLPTSCTDGKMLVALGGVVNCSTTTGFFKGASGVVSAGVFPTLNNIVVAICQNATASLGSSTPVSNPAVPTCLTGTNTQQATADFADGANSLSFQFHLTLPTDWTGNVDLSGKWFTSATTGNVVWQIATACVADGETSDPSFNTASTVTEAAKGTTLQQNDFSISAITMTGCAAGEELYLKFFRDPANGSDTLAATARLVALSLTIRRTMQ